MSKECQAGCKTFTGGEKYHHKDCVYYHESLSKAMDELRTELEAIKKERDEAVRLLSDLTDLQNGAPLVKYEKDWTKTMEEIYPFIAKYNR